MFLAKRRTRAYWYVKETIHFATSYQQQVGFYRFSTLVLAPHVNHFFNWHEPQPSLITACCRPKFDSFPSVSNITFLSRVAERIRTQAMLIFKWQQWNKIHIRSFALKYVKISSRRLPSLNLYKVGNLTTTSCKFGTGILGRCRRVAVLRKLHVTGRPANRAFLSQLAWF